MLNFDLELLNEPKKPEPNINLVSSIEHKGQRFRPIWNTIYYRPLKETFHEFILYLLREKLLGKDWFEEQTTKAKEDQHVVYKWFISFKEFIKRTSTTDNYLEEMKVWKVIPSGEVQALLSLAYDCYCLQAINRLPDFLIKRIKNFDAFQGVRYEIAVAAIVARAGFEITFLDPLIKDAKHCEFIAKHKQTGIELGVEAKSRHRKGALNEAGNFDAETKAELNQLFWNARKQKPSGYPYIIFIDVNLPQSEDNNQNKPKWVKEIDEMLDTYILQKETPKDPFNQVLFTNYSYFYEGNQSDYKEGGIYMFTSPNPEDEIIEVYLVEDIFQSARRYSQVPKEV